MSVMANLRMGEKKKKTEIIPIKEPLLFYSLGLVSEIVEVGGNGSWTQSSVYLL